MKKALWVFAIMCYLAVAGATYPRAKAAIKRDTGYYRKIDRPMAIFMAAGWPIFWPIELTFSWTQEHGGEEATW